MFLNREIFLTTARGAYYGKDDPGGSLCVAPGSNAAVAANTSYGILMLYHAVEIYF